MENTKNLIASPDLVKMLALPDPYIVCYITGKFETMEGKVSIPLQGLLAFLYDDCKLIFTFRENNNVFTKKEIAYTGRVSLYTIRDIGAPNLKIKTTPLTYPGTNEPLVLTIDFNNIISLAPIKNKEIK